MHESVEKCCEDVKANISLPSKANQVSDFLTELEINGFELDDQRKYGIHNCVAVTLGLNRMESLSQRKNNILPSALNEKVEIKRGYGPPFVETGIIHNFFGFHWKPVWKNVKDERVILKEGKIPTVMSTGYEFRNVEKPFEMAIELDRKIRVITNEYLPGGVYFPEPNTCILLENGENTLCESFINSKNKTLKVRESPSILTNVNKNRKDVTFLFSLDKPIITALPKRFKNVQEGGSMVLLSDIISMEFFEMGASPLETDLKKLENVCQSHLNLQTWWTNLFTNGCIPETKVVKEVLKELVVGKDEKLKKITNLLPDKKKMLSNVGNVMLAHANAVIQFKEDLAKIRRSEREQELLNMLKDNEKTQFSDAEKYIIPMLLEKDLLKVFDLQTICDTIVEGETEEYTAENILLLIKLQELGYELTDMKTILKEDETYLEVIKDCFRDYEDMVMEYFDHPEIDTYNYIEYFYKEFGINTDNILEKLAEEYKGEDDSDLVKEKGRRYNIFLNATEQINSNDYDGYEYVSDDDSNKDPEEYEDNSDENSGNYSDESINSDGYEDY
uniref:Uncharacterized protein n=1 Tax=Panagrolaimus davidi TaxID=227884 RepID=A0A914PCS8_9BILA